MSVRSIRDVAAAVRGRRKDLDLSQAELATRAGVSRKWISEFESGKSTAELGIVLRVLDELGFRLELREDSETEGAPSGVHHAVDLDMLLNELRTPLTAKGSDE